MEQLNLWKKDRRDVLHKFENQIASYYDVLNETDDKISYAEHINPHKGKAICNMEYEDYVDIKKEDLKGLTYDQILLFLKNIKQQDRIDQFKKLLKSRNISFEADLFTWYNEDLA